MLPRLTLIEPKLPSSPAAGLKAGMFAFVWFLGFLLFGLFGDGSHAIPGCPRTHWVVLQAGLRLPVVLLLQTPKCWGCTYEPAR